MTRKLGLLLPLLLASASLADQVTLNSGDRVSGSVVKKDGKTLTIKTASFGVVNVSWEQVALLESDAPLNVVLSDGKTVQAKLQTLKLADVVSIRDADEQKQYERLQHPRLDELWAGTATIGLAGTQGNAETRTFTMAMNAARATKTDKISLQFSAVKASALVGGVNADTAQAVRGGWGYNRTVSSRLFINTFNDYEYDRFQNLDLRFVLGGGLGYSAWKGARGRLDVLGGGAYNHEKFSPPALIRNSAEAYWGEDWSYKLSSVTSLTQGFRMFNNLSNTGQYRMNFDVGANTKLVKWLTWNLAFSDRYLSNPVPGRKTNDIMYTTGVGITFAR